MMKTGTSAATSPSQVGPGDWVTRPDHVDAPAARADWPHAANSGDPQHGVASDASAQAAMDAASPAPLWNEIDSHLLSIAQRIESLPEDDPSKPPLREGLKRCRDQLTGLHTELQRCSRADHPLVGAPKAVQSTRLAIRCRTAVRELQDLHRDVAPHAAKRPKMVKAIGLAVAGAALIAAVATLTVLLAPMVVPMLAAAGVAFLALAGAGAGITTVGAVAMVALAIREVVAKPAAYRHLAQRNPSLVAQLQLLDKELTGWLMANIDFAKRLDGDLLPRLCGEDRARDFINAVRDSDLSEVIKSAIGADRAPVDESQHEGAAAVASVNVDEASAVPASELPGLPADSQQQASHWLQRRAELARDQGLLDGPSTAAPQAMRPAAAVPRRKPPIGENWADIGAAKQLRTAITIRVWPEENRGLATRNYGHAAASVDRPDGTRYDSWWPAAKYGSRLQKVPGMTMSTYAEDKWNMLRDTTIEGLRSGMLTPRGRQKPVTVDGVQTWGTSACKVYLPVFGDNERRDGERKPCLFGLSGSRMQALWEAATTPAPDGTQPAFKLLSNSKNCAGMVLRMMEAGGAASFLRPPKFRFYAAPSKVLEYAAEVARRIDALNAKADALIARYLQLDGANPAISLEDAWFAYQHQGTPLPVAKDLEKILTDRDIASNEPFALMAKAKQLVALPGIEQRPTALAVLCGLRNRIRQLGADEVPGVGHEAPAVAAAAASAAAPARAPDAMASLPADDAMAGDDTESESDPYAATTYVDPDAQLDAPDYLADETDLSPLGDINENRSERTVVEWQDAAQWIAGQIANAQDVLARHGQVNPEQMNRQERKRAFLELDNALIALHAIDVTLNRMPEAHAFVCQRGLQKLVSALVDERDMAIEPEFDYVHQLQDAEVFLDLASVEDSATRHEARQQLEEYRGIVGRIVPDLLKASHRIVDPGFRGRAAFGVLHGVEP